MIMMMAMVAIGAMMAAEITILANGVFFNRHPVSAVDAQNSSFFQPHSSSTQHPGCPKKFVLSTRFFCHPFTPSIHPKHPPTHPPGKSIDRSIDPSTFIQAYRRAAATLYERTPPAGARFEPLRDRLRAMYVTSMCNAAVAGFKAGQAAPTPGEAHGLVVDACSRALARSGDKCPKVCAVCVVP